MGLVLSIDTKYSPKVDVYKLDSGETATYKLQKTLYQKIPFDSGAVIKFYAEEKPKSRKIDGKWEKLSETEPWINNYIVKNEL